MTRDRRHDLSILQQAALVTLWLTAGILAPEVSAQGCRGIDLLISEGEDDGLGYNYGSPIWADMTAAIDNAAASVTLTPNLEDLDQMLQFDALWVDQRWVDGLLTTTEEENITAFMNTGRRVVMIGENDNWAHWNLQILGLGGGTLSPGLADGPVIPVVDQDLTRGVRQVNIVGDGLAIGGTSLFDENFATLWQANVLTILSVNAMGEAWGDLDNAVFFTNVAEWVGCVVPAIFTDGFESGDADRWSAVVGAI